MWGSWTDAKGRRVKRKFSVYTLQRARTALPAERLKVEEQIKFGRPLLSKASFEEFAIEFLKLQERRISSRVAQGKISQAEYIRQMDIVETKLIPFFGSMKLAAVRKADVALEKGSSEGEMGQEAEAKRSYRLPTNGSSEPPRPACRIAHLITHDPCDPSCTMRHSSTHAKQAL